jgi:hypothetical protein
MMTERVYSSLGYAAGFIVVAVVSALGFIAMAGPDEPPIEVVKPIRIPVPKLIRTTVPPK